MAEIEIQVAKNGPYVIRGAIRLVDHEGRPLDAGGRSTVALCRCGLSETKPFCDGAHARRGFRAEEPAG